MSSTAVIGFVKDIKARNIKAVRERLGKARGESPNQRFIDPAAAGRVYTLLHKVGARGGAPNGGIVDACWQQLTS